jgi:uracil-DNA glycosylase
VPPQNKPLPAEIRSCRGFLQRELAALPQLRAILALGRTAHEQVLAASGLRAAMHPFAHARIHELPNKWLLADSYHCSRYNTNTGRLTQEMFENVFRLLNLRAMRNQ